MEDILIWEFRRRMCTNPEGRTAQSMYRAWFTVWGRIVIDHD